jgi:hypothetical protein
MDHMDWVFQSVKATEKFLWFFYLCSGLPYHAVDGPTSGDAPLPELRVVSLKRSHSLRPRTMNVTSEKNQFPLVTDTWVVFQACVPSAVVAWGILCP